uniref:DUF3887 domain-containing protein n=1 Tax=Roseburia sp. TaxID=2049040 RepID=UPI003FEE9726
MKAETYVDKIVKQMQCSKSKKEEIRKQLLGDIRERVAAGESEEAVIAQMGTVEELAQEFNESFSAKERKRSRKAKSTKMIIITILVIIGLFAIATALLYWMLPKGTDISESSTFVKEQVEAGVEEVINLLDDGAYDTLAENATEQMAGVLNDEDMDAAKQLVGDDWGARVELGTIYMQEVEQQGVHYVITQVAASYENVTVTYTITFDENMKLAGIYMK